MMTIKNLMLVALLSFGMLLPATAQDDDNTRTYDGGVPDRTSQLDMMLGNTNRDQYEVTAEDYERLINSAFKVDFRAFVINQLDLSEEEIEGFTPLYLDYMTQKAEILDRRAQLVAEHREEMKEENNDNEAEETADFIENYWETDINITQLKKDFFDKLEDEIPYRKAMAFFEIEEAVRQRIQRMQLVDLVPVVYEKVDPIATYYVALDDYNQWALDINGNVSLDHTYTHDGISKLTKAVGAMAAAEDIYVENWTEKKQKLMKMADDLTTNWRSLEHANTTHQAFMMLNEVFKAVTDDERFTGTKAWVNKLDKTARMINPAEQLTNQADAVVQYFDQAQSLVNELARQARMSEQEMQGWNDNMSRR